MKRPKFDYTYKQNNNSTDQCADVEIVGAEFSEEELAAIGEVLRSMGEALSDIGESEEIVDEEYWDVLPKYLIEND